MQGHLLSIMFAASAVGLAIALPVLTLCGLSQPALLRVALLATAVTTLSAAGATEGWQLLVVVGCMFLNGIYFPVMRSMMARAFGPARFGLALGAVGTLQQISQVVAPTAFPLVWKATAGVNGTVPGFPHAALGPRISYSFIPAGCAVVALAFAAFVVPTPEGDTEAERASRHEDMDENDKTRVAINRGDTAVATSSEAAPLLPRA